MLHIIITIALLNASEPSLKCHLILLKLEQSITILTGPQKLAEKVLLYVLAQ